MPADETEPRFTAEEIKVAMQAMLQEEAVLAEPVASELTTIIYTGLERSGMVERLHDIAVAAASVPGICPMEAAIHLAFQWGFRVRSNLLDAEKLHEMFSR